MRDIMNILSESQTTPSPLVEGWTVQELTAGLEEKLRVLAQTNPKGAESLYWIIHFLTSKDKGPAKKMSEKLLADMRRIIDGASANPSLGGALAESFSDDDLKKLLAIAGH
jgi:hypothetical protein